MEKKMCKYCNNEITKSNQAVQYKKTGIKIRNECKTCRSKMNIAFKSKSYEEKLLPCLVCNKLCMRKMAKPLCSLECRLKNNISIENGCWIWLGKKGQDGYGQIMINKKRQRVHRVSHELFIGPITDKLIILHSCNNPLCINPDHLSQGTIKQNSIDMIFSGNSMRGSKNHFAKLDEKKVISIRQMHKKGFPLVILASKFNVTIHCIKQIISRRIWKHIE